MASKRLRFSAMDKDTLATVNRILEVRFVKVEALADINKKLKSLDVKREDLVEAKNALEKGTEDRAKLEGEIAELDREVRILEMKKDSVSKYFRTYTKGTKSAKGAYARIFGDDVYQAYLDLQARESMADSKNHAGYISVIRDFLRDTWKIDAPDKLYQKFVRTVCMFTAGNETASGAQIVKGNLLKGKSEGKYLENLLDNIVTYMNNRGGVSVDIPDKSRYDYLVEYDENLDIVEFKMVAVDDEAE